MHFYYKIKGQTNTEIDTKIVYWKERVEFIFVGLMAILLIYLFNPLTTRSNHLDYEAKLMLYLFGFLLLITAKWDVFIKESKLFLYFQESL